jgi:hypothetical protein
MSAIASEEQVKLVIEKQISGYNYTFPISLKAGVRDSSFYLQGLKCC